MLPEPPAGVLMPVKVATLAAPLAGPSPAAALAAAALAARKADCTIRGRLMVKRPAKTPSPAPPPAAAAHFAGATDGQLPETLAPPAGTFSQPRSAASTATLVPPAEVPSPLPRAGILDELVRETAISKQLVQAAHELVPETTCSVQLVQAALDHAFNASGHATPTTIASSPPSAVGTTSGAGWEEAPWEFVRSRRCRRSTAFTSPAMKNRPPPPAWLHGRCHRCHDVGHWAAICREPIRCNNCRQFGHKAMCCTGSTAPRPPPVQDRRATQAPRGVCPPQSQRSRPQQQPEPSDVQLQYALAKQAELLRSELQSCLERVESFLVRAEAAFGTPSVSPDVTSPPKLNVSVVDDEDGGLYGCYSPHVKPYSPPQLVVSTASERENNVGVMVPVMQIIPEVDELCGEATSLEVGSIGTSVVALPSAPVALEPSQLLDFVDCGGLGVEVVHSPPVGVKVVASSALAHVPGALFAKKLCDFLVNLEADDPGSGKTIGCLLNERAIRSKSKKVGSGSLKNKTKKSGAPKKATPAA